MLNCVTFLNVFCIVQQCRSMSTRSPFVRDVFTCPYRFKCGCYCALSVMIFRDKVEVALAGDPAIPAAAVFCPSSKGVLSRGRSDPHRIRSVARFTQTWRTSAQESVFRLTVEAKKLSRALFGVSGKRLWRKGSPASTLTTLKAI